MSRSAKVRGKKCERLLTNERRRSSGIDRLWLVPRPLEHPGSHMIQGGRALALVGCKRYICQSDILHDR
jgi:hypothetical protein